MVNHVHGTVLFERGCNLLRRNLRRRLKNTHRPHHRRTMIRRLS